MATWVGQIRFTLPSLSSIEGQTPVICRIRVTIGFVATEVMQLAFHDRQATACTPFRQRRPSGPRIRCNVIFPHFIGNRPGMFSLETTREPYGVSVNGRV